MVKVVVFGNGNAVVIAEGGPRAWRDVPPFLLGELGGLAHLLRALPGENDAQLDAAAQVLLALIAEHTGPIDGSGGLVYVDEHGGFTCGTGARVVPLA